VTIESVLSGAARWTIVEGDCRDVLPTLPDRSVAHVITDPPYSAHVHAKLGTEGRSDGMRVRDELTFACITAEAARAYGAQFDRCAERWVIAFGDEWTLGYWMQCGVPWVRAGIWVKPDAMPQMSGDRPSNGFDTVSIMHATRPKRGGRMRWNGGGKAAVWSHCVVNPRGRSEKHHPTPKPASLMMDLVSDFTDPDDIILDPFAGSGTTGVAALRLGRRFVGIEREPRYAAIARERLDAEERGSTLQAARAGQTSLFDALAGGAR